MDLQVVLLFKIIIKAIFVGVNCNPVYDYIEKKDFEYVTRKKRGIEKVFHL